MIFEKPDLQKEDELYFSDESLDAVIKCLGNNQFELNISNKNARIDEVWFPYQSESVVLGSDRYDDMVYYPHFFGTVEKGYGLGLLILNLLPEDGSAFPHQLFKHGGKGGHFMLSGGEAQRHGEEHLLVFIGQFMELALFQASHQGFEGGQLRGRDGALGKKGVIRGQMI